MSRRWAAAVVVGVVSVWLCVSVEGSVESDTKEIRELYVKYVEGGIDKGEACDEEYVKYASSTVVFYLAPYAGKDAHQIAEALPPADGASTEIQVTGLLKALNNYGMFAEKICTPKKGLVCDNGTCAACSGVANPDILICQYCGGVNTIATTKEPEANSIIDPGAGAKNPVCEDMMKNPGGGGGGGQNPGVGGGGQNPGTGSTSPGSSKGSSSSGGGLAGLLNGAVFGGLLLVALLPPTASPAYAFE